MHRLDRLSYFLHSMNWELLCNNVTQFASLPKGISKSINSGPHYWHKTNCEVMTRETGAETSIQSTKPTQKHVEGVPIWVRWRDCSFVFMSLKMRLYISIILYAMCVQCTLNMDENISTEHFFPFGRDAFILWLAKKLLTEPLQLMRKRIGKKINERRHGSAASFFYV